MKPDAAPEIRGEFRPIRSRLPGLDVCELLPNAAKVMDKVTVLRSMTHPYPIHGVAYATTGVPQIDVPMELNPHDGRHWPFIGSVVDYLTSGKSSKRQGAPTNIGLPWPFSTQRVGEVARAGPYARLPGRRLQPALDRLQGEGDAHLDQDAAGPEVCRRRAVHGHHAGKPVRAGDGHRPARRDHARPPRPAPQPGAAARRSPPGLR